MISFQARVAQRARTSFGNRQTRSIASWLYAR